MAAKRRKNRVPQLKYTETRNIGWHVSFRDPRTGTPRRHQFGMVSRKEAEVAYHEWVAAHLRGETPSTKPKVGRRKLGQQIASPKSKPIGVAAEITEGSLLHVTSGFLHYEESRVGADGGVRRQGTITRKTYETRKLCAHEFLQFLNSRNGQDAIGRMLLADLTMQDVEAYNQLLVTADYSSSQVNKRVQVVKAIIDRAGRPEHGSQLLSWNWDSRDVSHGNPAESRKLPTLTQLKLVLQHCDEQRTAMVWMAIGCGFGQRDLAQVRVEQFDKKSYDLRRGKTGIERYGETPPMVWSAIRDYLRKSRRSGSDLMFITEKGMPLVHGNCDSVVLWWTRLRTKLGDDCKSLGGFYSLRHLGATEFGSRAGCSIGEVKRWLGHSASSQVADVYMKPVSPEDRAIVEWVSKSLKSCTADLRLRAKRGKKK